MHSIESERLIIRPYYVSDYPHWLAQYEQRLPSQHKYDEGKLDMSACTKEWFQEFVKKNQASANEDRLYIFGVFHQEAYTHIGAIDFSTLLRDDFQWARIGYQIHNHFWGQGYGKEAVKLALQLGFEQLNYHRIEAHINLDNDASIHLAKSVGMEYECTRKKFIYEDGAWTDNLIYVRNAEKPM
ncbi:GNAT family N-acetyltransferase [Bacillus sp. CGMCC 1.16541]|uniref:GNAT family N-acetyltransferase n=1 Tax=Bacillus sp. CGMCC 1.16541 TaxID=2185143 RepID=UPI000D72D2E5|nr:GNAT family N-acetyltransferase [Bacillus sp. CGMCC 1.16541]